MRKPWLLALSLVAGTGACTSLLGDFSLSSGPGTDSGPPGPDATMDVTQPGNDAGNDVTPPPEEMIAPMAVPIGTAVFLGQTATVDGTQSTPTVLQGGQYSWSIGSAPPGSQITTMSLKGATSDTVQFTPDLLGDYVLTLKVSVPGGLSSTNAATVNARLPRVFFAKGEVTDAGPSAYYAVADFDGGGVHSIVCPDTTITSVPNEIATFAAYASRAYDVWEAPAGQASRLAGFMMDYVAGTGYSSHLYSTTGVGSCDSGVTSFPSTHFGPGRPYGSEPHFSPDGARFAVYDDQWNVLTYAWNDPSSANTVASYPIRVNQPGLDPSGASPLSGYVTEPPRIEWIGVPTGDGGMVYDLAWAVPKPLPDGGMGWAIQTAPDQTGVAPMTYMTCGGVVPRRFAVLADGSVVASYRLTPTSPEDLVHLKVTGGQCALVKNYTNLPARSDAVATDFDVSPTGTIAFLKIDPTTQDAGAWQEPGGGGDAGAGPVLPGGYVYTVDVSGNTPAQMISPWPALFGPRWIGAGDALVFTRLDGIVGTLGNGGTLATSVVVVSPTGSVSNVVAKGDGVNSFVSTNGNASCAMVPGRRGEAVAAVFAALVALAGGLRVRSRKRPGR
jgi:hypothetical protein